MNEPDAPEIEVGQVLCNQTSWVVCTNVVLRRDQRVSSLTAVEFWQRNWFV